MISNLVRCARPAAREAQGSQFDANALNAKLDQIDQRANHLQLPTVYASNLYTLRSHIDLVRARLAKIPM
jgi:hypothetical protein